jgi:hypothetical protein
MIPRTSTDDSTFSKTTHNSGCMSPRYSQVTPQPKELRLQIETVKTSSDNKSGERLTDSKQRGSQLSGEKAVCLNSEELDRSRV